MSRSNDQLIKLAELIAKAQRGDDEINSTMTAGQIYQLLEAKITALQQSPSG
jgi:hypothetical protein